MQTATATVVENKLVPITGTVDSPVLTVTAQGMSNRFADFQAAGGGRAKALILAVQDGLKADHKEFALATSGMVEGTRATVETGGKTKREDGPNTADARKFQAYVRAIWGAVKLGRLPGFDSFINNEALVKAARAVLAGQHPASGEAVAEWAPCDWTGKTDADAAKDSAKKATIKAVKDAADDAGVDNLAAVTPEQFAALKSKAAAKLAEKAATDKLASMEKRAKKLAEDLVKSYGLDDAEEVLKRAIENLSTLAFAAAQ